MTQISQIKKQSCKILLILSKKSSVYGLTQRRAIFSWTLTPSMP